MRQISFNPTKGRGKRGGGGGGLKDGKKRWGFWLLCDYGNQNPFNRHQIKATKINHHPTMMNKFSCHWMTSYEFFHRQWIGPIFSYHLGTVRLWLKYFLIIWWWPIYFLIVWLRLKYFSIVWWQPISQGDLKVYEL